MKTQILIAQAAPEPIERVDVYEAAGQFSADVLRCKQIVEPGVSQKVADDYVAVVWAYGVIWSLFAAYGILLWLRSRKLAADLASLRRQIDGSAKTS